jgi:hypothetical protein
VSDGLGEEGVVLAHLVELTVAQQVHARVPDVRHHRLGAEHEQRRAGRAHAAFVLVAVAERVDLFGCGHDRAAQQARREIHGLAAREHRVERGALPAELALHGRAGRRGGDLAGGVSAHSVADHVEAERGVGEVRIFVAGPGATDVRGGVGEQVHGAKLPQSRRSGEDPRVLAVRAADALRRSA